MLTKKLFSWFTTAFGISRFADGARPFRKLDYTIDPAYQDLIDNEDGFTPLSTFSSSPESFVYGGIFSLSDTQGNPLPSGYQDVLSMQCAVGDVNAVAKVRGPNTTFFYQIYNDQTLPSAAVRASTLFLSAGVPVVIGPTESDAATAVATLFAGFNYTIISGSATAASLSDSAVYGSFYRTIPSDTYAAEAIADLMIYFNWTLVTPIYSRDTYGLSGQQEFTTQAINKGILSTCGRVLPPGELTGIQSTIDCLSGSQSTVVLLWMQARDAANVISALYNSAILPDLTFIGPDSWGDSYDLQAFSNATFPVDYLEGSFGVVPHRGDQSQFVDCVSKLTPESESAKEIPGFLDFWEATLRCQFTNDTDIPECTGPIIDREGFPNITCRCAESDNLTKFNSTHKVNYIYDAVFAVYNALEQIDGNCTGVSEATGVDYCNDDELDTTDLQRVVGVSQFDGFTGLVAFNGNDPVSTPYHLFIHLLIIFSTFPLAIRYDILQRRSNGVLVLVGEKVFGQNSTTTQGISNGEDGGMDVLAAESTSAQNITIDSSLLQFKNDQTPVSAIVPDQITFSDALGWTALIFIVLGLLIAFSFSIYFYLFRNEKVIKKTSPVFSQLILLGIVLCITSQIFWDVSQTTFTCVMKIWLLAIGFGLIMGNLLAKTYRIFKIFSNAKVTSLVIRDIDLLKFTLAVILLEIIMLCAYTFPAGLPTPVVLQSQSDSLLKYIECKVPSSFLQTAGIIMLLGVNFLLVLAAVIIAYLTRNVDSAFNESRYIAYTVYVFLLVTIILLPLYYTAGDSRSSVTRQFIIRTIAILVAMYFCLFALFLPKIILVQKAKRAEKSLAKDGAERERKRRIVEVGSTTVGVMPTSGLSEGSTGGAGGAYSRMLHVSGTGTTTTSSGSGDERAMPGGPRIGSTQGSAPDTEPSSTAARTPTSTGTSEYSKLISSLAKRSK